jgi:hypothetical protein
VSDDFGVYWDIALADGATQLLFIVRNADGSVKNCQSDMVLDISKGLGLSQPIPINSTILPTPELSTSQRVEWRATASRFR